MSYPISAFEVELITPPPGISGGRALADHPRHRKGRSHRVRTRRWKTRFFRAVASSDSETIAAISEQCGYTEMTADHAVVEGAA